MVISSLANDTCAFEYLVSYMSDTKAYVETGQTLSLELLNSEVSLRVKSVSIILGFVFVDVVREIEVIFSLPQYWRMMG